MRIVAIDYGRKRTGIAVTDPQQIIAGGLATVSTSDLVPWLERYISDEDVERLVVGEPRQPGGRLSENYNRVMQFVGTWRKRHPEVPVDMWDERYTSVLAHRAMVDGGLRRKARQDKALVDEISATIILQGYMEAKKKR